LLLNATQRYQLFLRDHGPLAERLPLHHVASYLGVTNVALSRIRGRLRAASTTGDEDPRQ
jgi:CRP-like cAMP-binding protein